MRDACARPRESSLCVMRVYKRIEKERKRRTVKRGLVRDDVCRSARIGEREREADEREKPRARECGAGEKGRGIIQIVAKCKFFAV